MAEVTNNQTDGGDARGISLGDFIAAQRRAAELSVRQLADRAGISNPYVSQIERGLRRPSADVLAALAQALQVSSRTLYSYAGVTSDDRPTSVPGAIRHDPSLTEQQKQALLGVYAAFVAAPEPAASPEVLSPAMPEPRPNKENPA